MKAINKTALAASIAAASLFSSSLAQALELATIDNTTIKIGGYIKLDAIASSYSDGSLGAGNLGRDFYVPSLTPVGGNSANSTLDFHTKQTRFNIGTTTKLDGHTLKTFIEMDFQATPNGNERVSNSYTPRLRHAFLTYDKWLFGQTWSTFQNVGALPETVDFIGNTDFGIFVRQPQIRYTSGNFQFSVENPETTVTPNGGGTRIVTDQNPLPDVVARYNYSADGLSITAAALMRQLSYNNGADDSNASSLGFSFSGKYAIGDDDIRFGFNTGSGMGRYIGLNVANGAVMESNGDLTAIDSTAYYLAYRHPWNAQWRSNITYSAISIDNDTRLTGTGVTHATDSLRVNLFYSPVKNLSFGGEVALANRELESGADGSMNRLQFSAKLAF
ncbi:DcaP family trimeric outer membrane transporter [Teredinibacter purpureus]|uniref:DcaP family trimeric outer membrane transporter n=1 Tax=Teredinibacter purpureus TaxID=2731756 RepID=UPI0005F83F35|nr:DcaP family trimeric outer membrane transporter [Teredinibacter purpureus]